MRFFIIGNGCELELPIRIAKEGNDVTYWTYKKGRADFDELLAQFGVRHQKTDQPNIPQDVDVIIYTDVMAPSLVDRLKKSYPGKVFGPPTPIAKLELNRQIGKEIAKRVGMPIPRNFTADARTAYQRIKKEKKAYVVKPHNNLPVWFTVVPDSYEDSLYALEDMMRQYSNVVVTCEERIFGAEIGIETFFDGEDFLEPFNLGFEFKRAYDGDQGPLTGEQGSFMYYGYSPLVEFLKRLRPLLREFDYHGDITAGMIVDEKDGTPYFLEWTCFDEETEILTKDGWKKYDEVQVGDLVLSINPETLEIDWKPVTNKFVADYEGKMINLKSKNTQGIDILVTPDHRFLIERWNKKIKFKKAKNLSTGDKIIRTGKWKGLNLPYIIVPERIEQHKVKGKVKPIVHPAVAVKTEVFCAFLGLFLAEGFLHYKNNKPYQICITQSPSSDRRKAIRKILEDLGFKYYEHKSGQFVISSIQLGTFLEKLLGRKRASQKAIPSFFKELDVKYLERLLYGFYLGDGSKHKSNVYYFTSSETLARDLMELIHKCGRVATIRKVAKKETEMVVGDSRCIRNHDVYVVCERFVRKHFYVDRSKPERATYHEIHYKGKIWDVEVADWHTMFVMRKGAAFFSGNCRMGFPWIVFQMDLWKRELSDVLYSIVNPQPSKYIPFDDKFLCAVRYLAPGGEYFDAFNRHGKNRPIVGLDRIVDGIPVLDRVRFEHVQYRNGKFYTGTFSPYTIVIVGYGYRGPEAIIDAYRFADQVRINEGYYRTDIGERVVRKDISILYSYGYVDADHFRRCFAPNFTRLKKW